MNENKDGPQNNEIFASTDFFRPNTILSPKKINFNLNSSGLGDMVNFLTSINWIAETQPHVKGQIFAPAFFLEIPQHFFEKFPNWKVYDLAAISNFKHNPTFTASQTKGFVNAGGAHLMDLGFHYFTNQSYAPTTHNELLQFGEEPWIRGMRSPWAKVFGRYAVITLGATADNRRMTPSLFRKIKEHLKLNEIHAVIVGREGVNGSTLREDYDLTDCTSLVNKTNLMTAAQIMNQAIMVVGIDNGLLHLAGMTEVPILFGTTVMSPQLRAIRRPIGKTFYIVLAQKDLPCRFCGERMRFLLNGHDAKTCLYGDNACTDLLAKDPYASHWFRAIDDILKDS